MQLLYLDPHQLEVDPTGVREEPGDIAGLATTIAEYGMLQPIGVTPIGGGRYRVVYGGRRRAAAIQLGLSKVPCIVLDNDDPDLLLRQLIENVQRQDLNDIEQARAFARLREHIIATRGKLPDNELDEAVGQAVGLGARTVRRYLGLLELPEEVQQMIRRGDLNVTQAQHLRRITNPKTQIDLARFAVEEGMSAAELSRLTTYFAANPNLTLDVALQALEQGEELRTKATPAGSSGGPLSHTPVAMADLPAHDDTWDDEEQGDTYLTVEEETIENQPKNKARVFRIRSLDQMVDESDRLARAVHDGDLLKWIERDEGAVFKVRLLLRQLESLTHALREIARQRNLPLDEE
ncbi:MAG TPA: ParB/RepB/Spo0J family partition protein [Chloroflexus aurantiacus]|jgi:ParB family chromosome partitioning protein|uniref:ParB-like partition protein n=1 Tax=Chloroflexus aurantiacus (strain ATCC 29366 / DSM 635 / J-10-fl) TaxID=324602 RepID=A9WJN3_CHLAA|nr:MULTISPECIES: ParB/RepB/Spo0J family partition protein [Chloroflexus]ABY35937.1 parB-like partition protein [Chloroflexus aurantiacus J-10-fl]GIV91555.1 MAG: chromosome partitioning protein ParB [Chloroflexus sp.]HBW69191.1 ParB/RepB/Spo0J family partition protein [Chloroflexus aurantiacus]